MANTIQLKLLETKRVECYINGYPYAYEGGYRIVVGEANATQFEISSVPTQYEEATYSVIFRDAVNRVVSSETDLSFGSIFGLPYDIARVAGYASMVISASLNDETVVWTPIKLKIWSANPKDDSGTIYIDVIFEIGEVETLPAGEDAYVTNVGTTTHPILNFGIPQGYSATIEDVTASVDANTGTPSVEVTLGGTDLARIIDLAFHNLKGETGETSLIMTEVYTQSYEPAIDQTFTQNISAFSRTPETGEAFIGFLLNDDEYTTYFITGEITSIAEDESTITCTIVDFVDIAGSTNAAAEYARQAANSAAEAAQSAIDAAETVASLEDYFGKEAVFVDELPETGDEDYLYLVMQDTGNLFAIYVYNDGEWTKLGEATLFVNSVIPYQRTLTASGWTDYSQTVTIENITPDDDVEVAPLKGYGEYYINYGIEAVEVVNDGVVFNCTTTPAESIPVKITVTKQQEIPHAEGYYTEDEIDELLAAERTTREEAEDQLQENIDAEVTRATAAEETLQENIDALNNNTVKKTGETSQTIEGNIIVTGDITVSGTTYTNDTETLLVNDNMIVANGQGATLNDLSGMAIRTDSSSAYGIVYDPVTGSVKLGLGSLVGDNDNQEFEFDLGEGNPIAVRAEETELTDGNVLEWDATDKKLIDSGLATSNIATKEELEDAIHDVEQGSVSNAESADSINAVALSSNDDLNDCVPDNVGQEVVYYASTNAIATTILNKPDAVATSFKVSAVKLYSSGTDLRCLQELRDNSGHYYIRRSTNSTTWGSWSEVILDNTAQTISGDKTFTNETTFEEVVNIVSSAGNEMCFYISGITEDSYADIQFRNDENICIATIRANNYSDENYAVMLGINYNNEAPKGIQVSCADDGTIYCTAITPQTNSDGTDIATTEWVNDRIAEAETGIVPTSVSIATSAWSSNSATVTVSGVTSASIVVASAAEGSGATVAECYIRATAQSTDSLTFTCNTTPTAAVTFNLIIIN